MPNVDVVVTSEVSTSVRARQVASLFDVPVQKKQTIRWRGEVPIEDRPWNVGLIEKRPGLSAPNTHNGKRIPTTTGKMGGRPNAVFEYVGPAMEDANAARQLLAIASLSRAI